MALVIASEGRKVLESQGIRAGVQARRADRQRLVPDGLCHAYDTETETVACGEDARVLAVFEDLPWERGMVRRCPACRQAVA